MKTYFAFKAVGMMAFGCAAMACGVQPNAAEKGQARQWLRNRLLSKTSPVFSFVYGGKRFRDDVANWQAMSTTQKGADGRVVHTTTFVDPKTKLSVRCVATEFPGSSAVEWVLRLDNESSAPTPVIEKLLPLDTTIQTTSEDSFTLISSRGDYNSGVSFAPVDDPIPPGSERTFAGAGGRSSGNTMPFFNLALPKGGMALAVGWSGQWSAKFGRTAAGVITLQAGQELTHFRLLPGESVRTPRMLVVHWAGSDAFRGSNLLRQVILDRYAPRRDGRPVAAPICATVNWTAPDGSYEGPHLAVLPQYAKVGVEVFWSDMDPQQWYPGGFPAGTGNWYPDKALYPHGLEPIGDAVKRAGMQYLLWFEPERVQAGTMVQREHPGYTYYFPGGGTGLFRLDLPEARNWMFDLLDGYVKRLHLGWIRWDFNMDPLSYWRACDAEDRKGITEMKYIEGLYALWDELRAKNPGLVIDLCASGGRRIDLESLTRGIQLWHSDMQGGGARPTDDQLQNGGLFRWIPFHGCGNFGYEPSYEFRSAMTSGNIMCVGYLGKGVSTALPENEEAMRRTVAVFKKVRPYMFGDFYPLFPHVVADDVWYGYQFHNEKLDAGYALVFRRPQCTEATATIHLHGVDSGALYIVVNQDTGEKKRLNGRELQNYSVEVAEKPGTVMIFYSRAK
ncbi:MAG: glycoside hydrolase family 36 protein [Fimbriimonadales bacterium]